ncbi:MAG: hypothetical protein EOP77_03735 [Variovorax sp.]|nr:MAG: hypothetical protein EOP77_03735 [Variovorax sp.]
MHSAPSVIYPVGRSRDAARILWTVWAAGACCACVASYQFDRFDWRHVGLVLAVVLPAVALHRTLSGVLAATLRFDGQHWSLSGAHARPIVDIAVALDLQSLLLVRLQGAGIHCRWRWLERRSDPGRWNDLRRALYARPPAASNRASPAAP